MNLKAISADIENWSCNASHNTDSSSTRCSKSENLHNVDFVSFIIISETWRNYTELIKTITSCPNVAEVVSF